MNFSVNQNRNLYVATKNSTNLTTDKNVVGALRVRNDKPKEYIWFEYNGAGGPTSSDKIKVSNIVSAKAIKAKSMDIPLNRYKVVLGDAGVIAGQDYILNIIFKQYIGMSDEEQYVKWGAVRGTSNMTEDKFYKTMAISIAKNMSRENNDLVHVYAHSKSMKSAGVFDANNCVLVKPNFTVDGGEAGATNNWYDGSAGAATDIDYIVLEEVEQPWIRGKMAAEKIPFDLSTGVIKNAEGDEFVWGDIVKEATVNVIKSGKLIADLEWFCMGERGDQYRGVGYPNNIETTYLVDGLNHNYDALDITYFYAGNNEDVQKSQKVITIVADNATNSEIMNAIIAAVNAASGNKLAIETLPRG